MELDKWQKEVLATEGNMVLCTGRQVGKSTIIAKHAANFAINNPKKTIMIISAVERQALLLFEKVHAEIFETHRSYIAKGKDKPTKHVLKLNNGSTIHCLPTGLSGHGIRGYTIDRLYADEAHYIPEDVWASVVPMLVTTGGDTVLLSTPRGKEGYFYEAFNSDRFKKFHISTEEVANERSEPMRTRMLEYLEEQKKAMSRREYGQEFQGVFMDDLQQFFPDDLIKQCMTAKRQTNLPRNSDYYLGVDIARMGSDEGTYEVVRRYNEQLYHVEHQISKQYRLTDTTKHILGLDNIYNFRKIYIDAGSGGLGVAVFDMLLDRTQTRRKIEAIDNAKRPLDKDGNKQTKMLKEDLYNNLLRLMEQRKIQLLDDPEIFQSFKSVQYEYTSDAKGRPMLRIFGNYTHIVEGLVRACWCLKDKSLNMFITY